MTGTRVDIAQLELAGAPASRSPASAGSIAERRSIVANILRAKPRAYEIACRLGTACPSAKEPISITKKTVTTSPPPNSAPTRAAGGAKARRGVVAVGGGSRAK